MSLDSTNNRGSSLRNERYVLVCSCHVVKIFHSTETILGILLHFNFGRSLGLPEETCEDMMKHTNARSQMNGNVVLAIPPQPRIFLFSVCPGVGGRETLEFHILHSFVPAFARELWQLRKYQYQSKLSRLHSLTQRTLRRSLQFPTRT